MDLHLGSVWSWEGLAGTYPMQPSTNTKHLCTLLLWLYNLHGFFWSLTPCCIKLFQCKSVFICLPRFLEEGHLGKVSCVSTMVPNTAHKPGLSSIAFRKSSRLIIWLSIEHLEQWCYSLGRSRRIWVCLDWMIRLEQVINIIYSTALSVNYWACIFLMNMFFTVHNISDLSLCDRD